MLDTNLVHFQSVFAHQFFVAPSDQNYFLARFSLINGLYEEFWWQSLQCVEKLLKAGLVLNGVSIKQGYGHNLKCLWEKHLEVFQDVSVKTTKKPEKLDEKFWSDAPLGQFIERINQMGHPDSRYGLLSYANKRGDLFKLDQLVFELRRRTIGLDWIVGEHFPHENYKDHFGKTYRDLIRELPDSQFRPLKIPNGNFSVMGETLEDAFYAWNFPFSDNPKNMERKAPASVVPVMAGFKNSYLFLLSEKLKKESITKDVEAKINWLCENIKLGKDVERDFKERLKSKP